VAHAQREIGLAVGEPPTAKGYPPSVFALLPNLIERAGVGRHGLGSITAIYTVLAEGDDANDPIVDIARASLDGQVMLSRKLADAAHYPAIDLNGSISRVIQKLLCAEDLQLANRFRRMWSLYQQNQDLIQVGAYESGSDTGRSHPTAPGDGGLFTAGHAPGRRRGHHPAKPARTARRLKPRRPPCKRVNAGPYWPTRPKTNANAFNKNSRVSSSGSTDCTRKSAACVSSMPNTTNA
jgi:hypothetical protein